MHARPIHRRSTHLLVNVQLNYPHSVWNRGRPFRCVCVCVDCNVLLLLPLPAAVTRPKWNRMYGPSVLSRNYRISSVAYSRCCVDVCQCRSDAKTRGLTPHSTQNFLCQFDGFHFFHQQHRYSCACLSGLALHLHAPQSTRTHSLAEARAISIAILNDFFSFSLAHRYT